MLGDTLSTILGSSIENITIESTYFPPISIDKPLAPGGGVASAAGGMVAKLVKPKITITIAGNQPMSFAPYGEPEQSSFAPLVMGGLSLLGAWFVLRRIF